jgi:cadmium resistance transport/sequestration family protein
MEWFVSAFIAGITAFVATNIDDIVILMLFFAQVNDRFRPRHIVAGQYLGFIVLLLAALPGFFGGLLLPKSWIGLLGLLPIAIGIKQLLDHDDDEPTVQTVAKNETVDHSKLAHLLHPQTYQVAAVTVANGGDNIGIYVPLFASSNLPTLVVIISVFLILVAVWCGIAARLAQHPAIAPILNRYVHRIVPFVLIILGIYILMENGSYKLFIHS